MDLPLEIRTDSLYSISCEFNRSDRYRDGFADFDRSTLSSASFLSAILTPLLPAVVPCIRSLSGITKFLPAWLRNSFRLTTGESVKNQDMIVHILALINLRGADNSVLFVQVRGHAGEVGNDAADVSASLFGVILSADAFVETRIQGVEYACSAGEEGLVYTRRRSSTCSDTTGQAGGCGSDLDSETKRPDT